MEITHVSNRVSVGGAEILITEITKHGKPRYDPFTVLCLGLHDFAVCEQDVGMPVIAAHRRDIKNNRPLRHVLNFLSDTVELRPHFDPAGQPDGTMLFALKDFHRKLHGMREYPLLLN